MAEPNTTPAPEQIRDGWDRIAAGFDRFTTPLSIGMAEHALGRVGLRAGMRFLDVAAGSGALSIPAARLGARVVAADISPTMIERLEARALAEGLSHLEGRVMDGHALDLEDDTFDIAGSQNGVSLFPDLMRGLRELVRVTKPGGRVMLVAFGAPRKVEFLTFFLGAIQAVAPDFTGLPTDPPPLPFQVADPDVLRRRMTEAGLTDVRVETTVWRAEFESGTHLWDVVTHSNPIGAALVADLEPAQAAEVRQVLDGMLRERSGGGPAVLDHQMNIGVGAK